MFPTAETARMTTDYVAGRNGSKPVDKLLARIGVRILRESALGGNEVNVIAEYSDEVMRYLEDKGYTAVYRFSSQQVEGHYKVSW